MSKWILASDNKGTQRTFSERTWHLMRSMKEQGDKRKGWTKLKELTEGEARDFERALSKGGQTKAPVATGLPRAAATFIPKEIEEHAKKKAAEAAAGAGEKVRASDIDPEVTETASASPAASQPEPQPEAPAPSAQPSAEAPAGDAAGAADDLGTLPHMGVKSVEALNAAGITSFKGLLDAGPDKIGAALDAAKLGPKKAVVPKWIAAAEQKVNAPVNA